MLKLSWFFRPLFIFIASLLALGLSLFIFIRSYLQVNDALRNFVIKSKVNPETLANTDSWLIILTLSILVGLIIAGLILIFVYYSKIIQLYRMQQNFINGFTHELKTPIASLQLFLNTFQKHELPRQEQLKYIDYMLNDTLRLANNVDEILNLAKIEEKRYDFSLIFTNLEEEISKHIQSNQHQFENFNIELTASGNMETYVDTQLFKLVVMNLIVNAYNHNSKAEKKLEIILKQNQKKIEILFKDNGNGIDDKDHKKVFKKFYQSGHSAKGSGLGLYLVQTVSKALGGSIQLKESELGKGSTFLIELPIKEQESHG